MIRLAAVLYLFSALLGSVVPSAIDVAVDEKKRANHVVDSLDLLLYVLLGSQFSVGDCFFFRRPILIRAKMEREDSSNFKIE